MRFKGQPELLNHPAPLWVLETYAQLFHEYLLVIKSIIGTTFIGRVVEETTFGPHTAVIPEVEGSAYVTGRNTFVVDPENPLRSGFILR